MYSKLYPKLKYILIFFIFGKKGFILYNITFFQDKNPAADSKHNEPHHKKINFRAFVKYTTQVALDFVKNQKTVFFSCCIALSHQNCPKTELELNDLINCLNYLALF